jgi:hypothetical protein
VVLPASICAIIPMLRIFENSDINAFLHAT